MGAVEDDSFWFLHRNEAIASMLERFPPAGPLWDIGGGNGFQARELQTRGWQVVLVEPGAEACALARKRGVEHVFQATLQSLAVPDQLLAAASLFDVIEHVAEPSGLLGELRRVLRPGGLLFVTVPAHDWLWSGADDDAEHHRRYCEAALRRELAAADLEPLYTSYYFAPLLPVVLLLRALPYRLGLARRGESLSMDAARREHGRGSLGARVMSGLLRMELPVLSRGRLGFGASLIGVARRPS
jgi:ubiquinone/menaquinone biosynthesis C-methylase UbiE